MNWFDCFVLIVLIVSLVKGFFTGLVMQVASLVGFIISAVFAGQLAGWLSPWLQNLMSASPHIVKPFSYILAFLLIVAAFLFAGRLLHEFLKAIKLDMVNRITGSVFCMLEFIFVVSILLNVVVELDQNAKLIKPEIREHSYTYDGVKSVAPAIIPFLRFGFDVNFMDEKVDVK